MKFHVSSKDLLSHPFNEKGFLPLQKPQKALITKDSFKRY
jgi:hypothetical protein